MVAMLTVDSGDYDDDGGGGGCDDSGDDSGSSGGGDGADCGCRGGSSYSCVGVNYRFTAKVNHKPDQ